MLSQYCNIPLNKITGIHTFDVKYKIENESHFSDEPHHKKGIFTIL